MWIRRGALAANGARKGRRGSARAAGFRQKKKPGARIGSGHCLQTGPGKDAGVWRGRPDSGKRRNPARVSAPGTAREALTKTDTRHKREHRVI